MARRRWRCCRACPCARRERPTRPRYLQSCPRRAPSAPHHLANGRPCHCGFDRSNPAINGPRLGLCFPASPHLRVAAPSRGARSQHRAPRRGGSRYIDFVQHSGPAGRHGFAERGQAELDFRHGRNLGDRQTNANRGQLTFVNFAPGRSHRFLGPTQACVVGSTEASSSPRAEALFIHFRYVWFDASGHRGGRKPDLVHHTEDASALGFDAYFTTWPRISPPG